MHLTSEARRTAHTQNAVESLKITELFPSESDKNSRHVIA